MGTAALIPVPLAVVAVPAGDEAAEGELAFPAPEEIDVPAVVVFVPSPRVPGVSPFANPDPH